MTIEALLTEQNEILKGIHTLLATQQQLAGAPLAAGTVTGTATEEKKPRKGAKTADAPKDELGLVEGDPSGTRYWVSEALSQVYAQTPGNPDPEDKSFKIESAAHYTAKKDEFAKKSAAAEAAQKAADTAPSATADLGTASDVTFTSVVDAIKALNSKLAAKDPAAGRSAVLGVLKHFGCEGKTVPALEAVGKNAEILAHVQKLSADADASGTDDLGL